MRKIKIILWMALLLIFIFFQYSSGKESEKNYDVGKVTTDILKIRSGLSTEMPYVGVLELNEEIQIYEKIDNWYIIKNSKNLVGAVCADYIEIVKEKDDVIEAFSYNLEIENEVILSQDEQNFFNIINKKRAENSLPEFEIDEKLQNVARLKCQDLVENNYFSHTSPQYGTLGKMLKMNNISYILASENIAKSKSAESAINLLMKSQNHKNNILNYSYNYTGIAIQKKYDGINMYVQIFLKK